MKFLLLGAGGQLGTELRRALAPLGTVCSATRDGRLPDGTGCEKANLERENDLVGLLDRLRPDAVVNAAAYTAVDRAEVERETAFLINAQAPKIIAKWCVEAGIPIVHYSTDYVFDGQATRPYRECDNANPQNVYGASKLAGEDAVRAAGGQYMIFRAAWVYASHSNNFLRTMLRVASQGKELKVVDDQIGTPTPASLIADVTADMIRLHRDKVGTWHVAANGETSWYGFAEAIFHGAVAEGLLQELPRLQRISASEYPATAQRPPYSHLDVSKLERDLESAMPDWRDGLTKVLRMMR